MAAASMRYTCVPSTGSPMRRLSISLIVLLTLLASTVSAQTTGYQQLWGPKEYSRAKGQPEVVTETFSGLAPEAQYEIRVANETVSAAIVRLNGVEIFGTSAFNQKVELLVKPVILQVENTLTIELRGKIEERMSISIWGNAAVVDPTPPTITAYAMPAANDHGWRPAPVMVAFQCTDYQSGIAVCPPSIVVTTDGAGQTFSGQAKDVAGNTATASVTINVDSAAPSLAITAPGQGASLMTSAVAISGTVSDALAGLDTVTCNGGPAAISGSGFTCTMNFEDGSRSVTVVATDKAGNTTTQTVSFGVLTLPRLSITEPAGQSFVNISPVTVRGTVSDPDAVVKINGVTATANGGTFVATVPLVEGNNTLSAVGAAANGKIGTANVQVTLDTTPPRVAITSPADQFETVEATVAVAGTVNDIVVGTVNDEQARVTVNGVPATVVNRTFIAPSVALQPGENTIQVVGRDRVGNQFTTRITVVRDASIQASIHIAGGTQQTAAITRPLASPLAVRLTDAAGLPVPNANVVFKIVEGNGSLTSGTTTAPWVVVRSAADGRAEARLTLGSRAGVGNNKVQATATGFGGTAIFTANATAGLPAFINIDAGLDQTGAIGSALAFPFIAVVTDAGHNRLADVPVTFTVTSGGGTIGGESVVTTNTDSDGRALASLTLGLEPGNAAHRVEATFPGHSGNPAAFAATAKVPGDASQTRISGVVLDNSNAPLAGVTMRLYQAYLGSASNLPQAVATPVVSNEQGQFTMTGVPIGAYKLVADGTTIPGDDRYPPLEFDMVTVAGQDNTLALPIYLPVLDPVHRLCVSETIGGSLTLPSVPGFSFSVAPGAATFPGGARSGCITVTPVHGDKVPMVPGFGQQPRFVITVQPVGTHFNPPAQISFPNVDGLQPREVTEMYSYDHDLSTFIAIGTASVSDDGSVLRSDPGVGVMKAGWHCGGNPNPTGAAATCPDCKKCQGTNCVPDPTRTGTLDENNCCFNGEKLPKKDNPFDTLIAKCPQRLQNDRTHLVDGCSLPSFAGIFTPGGTVQDPVGGSLGRSSTRFGLPETLGPGQSPSNFPCNNHDKCYQTCKSTQAGCDSGMERDMTSVCQAAYPEASCPLTGLMWFRCLGWYEEKSNCAAFTSAYKWGLDRWGEDAWKERQEQFCDCCP
ncbi:MAG TPA: hypothetical protein VE974_26440 [Thermoanaerobaculia bacterium]|nr:hypothetical protein [Thermoanaerobaculia bacterium]